MRPERDRHARVHSHSLALWHWHSHTHSGSLALTLPHSLTLWHSHTHSLWHSLSGTRTHTHSLALTLAHTLTLAPWHSHLLSHSLSQVLPCSCKKKKRNRKAVQAGKRQSCAHTQILFFHCQQLLSPGCGGGGCRAAGTACVQPFPPGWGSPAVAACLTFGGEIKAAHNELRQDSLWVLARVQCWIKEVTSRVWLHMRGFHKAAYYRSCGEL